MHVATKILWIICSLHGADCARLYEPRMSFVVDSRIPNMMFEKQEDCLLAAASLTGTQAFWPMYGVVSEAFACRPVSSVWFEIEVK